MPGLRESKGPEALCLLLFFLLGPRCSTDRWSWGKSSRLVDVVVVFYLNLPIEVFLCDLVFLLQQLLEKVPGLNSIYDKIVDADSAVGVQLPFDDLGSDLNVLNDLRINALQSDRRVAVQFTPIPLKEALLHLVIVQDVHD